ncbi:MAG TPA: aminotransferase class III-fold pyridoxal phosphate-dependent enzyme [Gaiellaceae bacterium]
MAEAGALADDRAHVLHTWAVQSELDPIPVVGGEGSWFRDADGRRYLDFASQSVSLNLGHQHPRVVAAIREKASELCTIGPGFAEQSRSGLARMLAEVTPGDLVRTLFVNDGAEANENAIKLARWYTGRQKIVARYRSYHGATAGALSLTGDARRWAGEPGIPGIVRILDPYEYRCPAGHPDPCPVCTGAPHLEDVLAHENPETVAAVVLETIAGANGVLVPPPGYLRAVREVCDRHGILLVLDEVMAGFGRTGRWFACEHWDVVPDILTLAKGLTSGYVPLGAMVVSQRLSEWVWDHPFPSGTTTSGHPLACAAGVASLETMRDDRLVERAAEIGEELGAGLRRLGERHSVVGEVRGLGLLWGVELVRDRATKEPLEAKPLAKAALARGLYLYARGNVLLVAPPLVASGAEVEQGLELLDEVLTNA